MELTTATRKTITKAQAVRYRNGVESGEVGDSGCGVRAEGSHGDGLRATCTEADADAAGVDAA